MPQYLLARMLSIIFSSKFVRYFQQVRWWFPLNGLSICIFTNIMKNIAQFRDRELRLLVCFFCLFFLLLFYFVFANHTRNAFLVALECAACVCSFIKLWVWVKNPLKICKPGRNEEPAVRPWEGQWNCVIHHFHEVYFKVIKTLFRNIWIMRKWL